MTVSISINAGRRHSDSVILHPLKELKAETEFFSYLELLEVRKDGFFNGESVSKILAEPHLFDWPYAHAWPSYCFIIDTLRDGKSDWSCVLRLEFSSQLLDSSLQLHDPDADVRAFRTNALKLDQNLRSSTDLCSNESCFTTFVMREYRPGELIL